MMKRFALGLAAVALTLMGFATPAQAADAPACVSATFTTHVAARPDSAISGGTWATDSFTRTTTVTCTDTGYHVVLADVGTFTTVAGAHSPQAGLELTGTITGSFSGGTQFDVVSVTGPQDPAAGASGEYSSSEWIKLVFPDGAATQGAWSWTYTRFCGEVALETWTNAPVSTGDIAGAEACVEIPPTSTTAPTSTGISPSPSTTTPTETSSPSSSSAVIVPSTTDAVTPTPTVLARQAANDESLAYTGSSASPLGLLIAAGLLLVSGTGFLIVALRRRRRS